MKLVSNKFFTLIIFIYGAFFAIAGNPPVPNPAGKKKPPPPPGLPIDENVIFLLMAVIVFGIYIIYKHQIKTKTPI